ncbi:MAG: hypothetical protein Phog2KO_39270 [Phototrophicaceae bacterium]
MGIAAQLVRQRQYNHAMRIYNALLHEVDRNRYPILFGEVLLNRANCLWQITQGNMVEYHNEALAMLDLAELVFRNQITDVKDQCNTIIRVVLIRALVWQNHPGYKENERYIKSLDVYNKNEWEIYKATDLMIKVMLRKNRGTLYDSMGKHLEAIEVYKESIETLIDVKSTFMEKVDRQKYRLLVDIYLNIGHSYINLADKKPDETLRYLESAHNAYSIGLKYIKQSKVYLEDISLRTGLLVVRYRLAIDCGVGTSNGLSDDIRDLLNDNINRDNPDDIRDLLDDNINRDNHSQIYIRLREILGNLYVMEGDWTQAYKAYVDATNMADEMYQSATTRNSRLALTRLIMYATRRGAYSAVKSSSHGIRTGIEFFENRKIKLLTDLLGLDESSESLVTILNAIPTNTALVIPLITIFGSLVWMLPNGTTEINSDNIIFLDHFTWNDYGEIMNNTSEPVGWLRSYMDYLEETIDTSTFLSNTETIPESLWSELMQPIADWLKSHQISNVILAPSSGLQLLPLHAANNDGQYFSDMFSVSYVPSGKLLPLLARHPLKVDQNIYVGCHEFVAEGEMIAKSMPSARLDTKLTYKSLNSALPNHSIIHLSTHGKFAWDGDPHMSALQLGNRMLSLSDIIQHLKLREGSLVVLSACETGISEAFDFVYEFVGLYNAFIEIGASGVICTMWAVDSVATALFMAQFYSILATGESISKALQQTQIWLRQISYSEAEAFILSYDFPSMFSLSGHLFRYHHGKEKPFKHPHYWAAFMFIGVDIHD